MNEDSKSMLNYMELNAENEPKIETLSRNNPILKIEIKLELKLKSKPKAECKPNLTLKLPTSASMVSASLINTRTS